MNNDLISRKSLIRNLNQFALEHFSALVNDLILKEPEAYDVDAVCEELRKNANYCNPTFDEDGYAEDADPLIDVETAIEIVRNGGKKE